MKKFKAVFIAFGILLAFIILMIIIFGNKVVIERYDANVIIDENGDMTVVERWDMNYRSRMNVRFRDINFGKYSDENPLYQSGNNLAEFDPNSVKVRVFDEDNQEITDEARIAYSFNGGIDEQGYPVECYPDSGNCESLFVDMSNAGGLDGKISFEYTYKIIGAITQYSDISELNWILYEYAEGTVKDSLVTITLPANNLDVDHLYVWGHGLSKGTIEPITNNKILIKTKDVKKNELLEFRILADNSLFTGVMDRNKVISNQINKQILINYEENLAIQTNRRIFIANIVLYSTFGMMAIMVAVVIYVYKKYDKEYEPKFKGDYYRELPSGLTPAEMSYLYYFGEIHNEDVTATLLDLIRRGYIQLDIYNNEITSKDADFIMYLTNKNIDGLLPYEYHLINWFFDKIGDGKKVSTKQIEDYSKKGIKEAELFQRESRQFIKLVKSRCLKYDFFEKGLSKAKGKALVFALIPGFLLFVAFYTGSFYNINNGFSIIISIVTLILYIVYIASIKKRSINGNEEFVKWKAFKNFLTDFSSFKDYPIPGVVVWEHYLVYATSLRIADQVMEQLKVKLPESEFEFDQSTYLGLGYRTHGFYYGFALGRFNRTLSIARSNTFQTITAHNAARVGAGGRGGGFGGGRSFGGGGGGGRSR